MAHISQTSHRYHRRFGVRSETEETYRCIDFVVLEFLAYECTSLTSRCGKWVHFLWSMVVQVPTSLSMVQWSVSRSCFLRPLFLVIIRSFCYQSVCMWSVAPHPILPEAKKNQILSALGLSGPQRESVEAHAAILFLHLLHSLGFWLDRRHYPQIFHSDSCTLYSILIQTHHILRSDISRSPFPVRALYQSSLTIFLLSSALCFFVSSHAIAIDDSCKNYHGDDITADIEQAINEVKEMAHDAFVASSAEAAGDTDVQRPNTCWLPSSAPIVKGTPLWSIISRESPLSVSSTTLLLFAATKE